MYGKKVSSEWFLPGTLELLDELCRTLVHTGAKQLKKQLLLNQRRQNFSLQPEQMRGCSR